MKNINETSNINKLPEIIKNSEYVVFFTGAGASTETTTFTL